MTFDHDRSSVDGQTAFVVGAGSGIGRGVALLLARRGMRVACVDRDGGPVGDLAGQIIAGGGEAIGQAADVTAPDSVQRAFAMTVAEFGQVHAVVNCAGIQGPMGRRSHEVDLAEFDAAIAVNLRGALVVSQAALPHLVEHGYGRIAHVASIAGKEGNPSMIGYSASKAGLIGLVKAMAKEYASDGITINALAPAVIRTAFLDEQPQQVIDYMTAKIPMGRVGTIEEVAEMINFMISPACSFTTGFCFDASGGRATY
ncbi:SDR family NAD(P)-dependent oxidoreductase [Microlunatus sp. GCM10028923]|uniref:SDR family NAD(P)-dependent oxidoreductase n=1 Tax=Microlunatus sp. GCM10028923 TaxID=3273400 RepID=UPI003622D4A5